MAQIAPGSDKEIASIELRCLECMVRIQVAPEAKEFNCPNCGTKFLIYWPAPDIAKIKGIANEKVL